MGEEGREATAEVAGVEDGAEHGGGGGGAGGGKRVWK